MASSPNCIHAEMDRGSGRKPHDSLLATPETPGIVIRGEFIIPKERFADKYASKFSNPRNFVAGVVNQKTTDASKYRDIDFVAYEVIQPQLPVAKQFEYLTGIDVEVVRFWKKPP